MTVFEDVQREWDRHIELWGVQEHPDGTDPLFTAKANNQKSINDFLVKTDPEHLTWKDILLEEVWEALAEHNDPDKLEEELIQAAAVCLSWVTDLRLRKSDGRYE